MSVLWIIYWASVAAVILLSIIIRTFFLFEGKQMPRIYEFLLFLMGFVPVVGTFLVIVLILLTTANIFMSDDDEFTLNKHPFKNEKINDFFMK